MPPSNRITHRHLDAPLPLRLVSLACVFAAIGCGGTTIGENAGTDAAADHHGLAEGGRDAGKEGGARVEGGVEAGREGGGDDGHVEAGAEGGGAEGGVEASTEAGLPAVCAAAIAKIDWTGGGAGIDCLTAAPTGWAAGLGATWQDVFKSQCETSVSFAACTSEADAYFTCLSKMGGSCSPCVTPNAGECKGSAGVVYSTCGNELTLAQCACKPPGAPCVTDADCCPGTTLGLTCLSSSCTY